MEGKRTNKAAIWVTVLLLIVVFPGVGYIYLQRGLEYHRESYGELQELGPLPAFSAVTSADTLLSSDKLTGNTVVPTTLESPERATEVVASLNKLQDQFDHLPNVLFIGLTADQSSLPLETLRENYGVNEKADQWHILRVPSDQLAEIRLALARQLSVDNWNQSQVILTDRFGQVRKVYNALDNNDMGRLIEHISYIIPRNKKEKPVQVRREEL